VVNNARVLMPPWIRVKNLASRVLALVIRRLPEDWKARYGYFPYLLETFVHIERHAGTCYKASNWVYVGETKGRGKMDRYGKAELPRKAMFVYPLVANARELLRQNSTPLAVAPDPHRRTERPPLGIDPSP
jgi:hypothetical protein